ncbi:MAG: hypothetical protein WC581_11510, partial [Thermodesulfovibrionales bacterium]
MRLFVAPEDGEGIIDDRRYRQECSLKNRNEKNLNLTDYLPAVFGLSVIDLARPFVLRTYIFPASYGPFVMDAALECCALKVRAVAIRILRHIVRPFGIIFVKAFFHL